MLPTPLTASDPLVYEPSEDSFFILDCLEAQQQDLRQLSYPIVLEIGSGSGVITTFIRKLGVNGLHLAADLNLRALEVTKDTWRHNGLEATVLDCLRGDLCSAVRSKSIDILVFNPPYVPSTTIPVIPNEAESDLWLDLALDGGKDGMVITQRLLDQLDRVLSSTGKAYILFVAPNRPTVVTQELKETGWAVRNLGTRKAGREALTVLEIGRGQAQ